MSHVKKFSKMEHLSITSCIISDLTIAASSSLTSSSNSRSCAFRGDKPAAAEAARSDELSADLLPSKSVPFSGDKLEAELGEEAPVFC